MHGTSEFILNFVLNSCWQIGAIFVVATLAAWLLRNGPARSRYTLWVVALAACLIVPLVTAMRFVPKSISRLGTSIHKPSSAPQVQSAAIDGDELPVDHLVTRRAKPVNTTTQTALFLTLAYLVFIFARGIRFVRFWRRKENLRRSAIREGISAEVQLVAQRCCRIFGVDVPVATSDQAHVPYTIGARRPLVLLPEAFCSGADETKLLSVIGHEMAHVARRDFLSNLACELIMLPISFHPLTLLIKRQIDRTRELACDELVTERVVGPRVYARSLLWAADVAQQYSSQAFMLSILDGKILEERIMRLTRNKRRVGPGVARVMMSTALLFLFISAISVSLFSLELQTQARAVVQPLQMINTPAPQDPAPSTVTALQQRNERQLNAPAPEDRAKSACDAARRGDVAAIPSLIALLGDDSETQLVKCWDTSRWTPALETFKNPSPGEQAALALASFGRTAFVPLTNELISSNATVRRNAAWAIGELTNMLPGERAGAVPQLISLLSDSDEWVRMAAARSLGELRDRRSLDGLIAKLADDKWRVRQVVVWALSEMKDERAVTALCSVLLSDVRVEIRRGAAEALGEIRSADALPSLKQALNDEGVSKKAAWAIAEIEG